MSEKKNIDKLFKEQLKDFEVAPNDAVWEHIERELHKDKRKRRVIIPIWWKVAGVAALLVLLFTVGNSMFNDNGDNSLDPNVVETDTPNKEKEASNSDVNTSTNPSDSNSSEDLNTTEIVDNNTTEDTLEDVNNIDSKDHLNSSETANKNNTVANASKDKLKKSSVVKNKSQQRDAIVSTNPTKHDKDKTNVTSTQSSTVANTSDNVNSKNEVNSNNNLKKNQSEIDKLIKDIKTSKSTQVTATTTSEKLEKENIASAIDTSKVNELIKEENAIEKAIADAEENDSIKDPEKPLKRWSVAPNIAPVYFNTLGKGSSLDNQFVNNTKEGDVNVSYGVKGSYAINKKLKIRAGINKVDLGYSTNNILAFDGASPNSSARQMKNVRLNDTLNSAYVSANSVSFASGPEILFTKEQGSIDQQLGFIEVPIELEYNLVDKKIGLNLIGGFSTLFLSNNEIYSVLDNGDRTLVGEATNINNMSYSANFGVGVNYNISEKLQFNLEPTFKYQINTFNDTSGDFQPFFIGVYTGLSFKF
nr:hypothetical protein [uncultured Psychroserpens sp.]